MNYPQMSEERRKLMLTIWAGYEPMHEVLHRLHWLDANAFNYEKVNAGLRWLVRNQLTGKRFVEFWKSDCAGSDLNLYSTLISKLEKEEKRILTYEKDFLK